LPAGSCADHHQLGRSGPELGDPRIPRQPEAQDVYTRLQAASHGARQDVPQGRR
ncbi:hypothetical protein BN1723_019938, partial [Verticillium longisporum]